MGFPKELKDFPTNTGKRKYVAAAEAIQRMIRSRRLKAGSRLPSERELAKLFQVAYLTVRQALHHLEQQGIIQRKHGCGTFVANPQESRIELQRRLPSVPPVWLIGLGPDVDEEHEPVNWEPLLYRYQGIMEGGFYFGLPIRSLDLPVQPRDCAWWISQLKGASGVILEKDALADEIIEALQQKGIPVVATSRHGSSICSEVQTDTTQGAKLATEYLLELGHRRIGLIVGDQNKPLMRMRLDGYRDALAAHDVPYESGLTVIDRRGLAEDGAQAARKLLALPHPPTAIFAASDQRAFGVLEALQVAGMNVPDDMSVVGFDDLRKAARLNPPLTTVRNPLHESGFEAVRLLSEHLKKKHLGKQIVTLPMSLVVRGTTASLRPPSGEKAMDDGGETTRGLVEAKK